MKKIVTKQRVKFYLWVALSFLIVQIFISTHLHSVDLSYIIGNNVWALVFITPINFILFEVSIPFVLKRRRVVFYNVLLALFLLFIHLFLYSYGSYVWRSLGIQLGVYLPLKVFPTLDKLLENQSAYSLSSVFFFGIIRHIYNYIRLKQSQQQLRIEKQAAELNYLRSQTNPHFLFNTLNNIYSLARNKSDLAPESILRLSKILRFMLYETDGEYISIDQELKIISNYIELEKLRYDESLRVNFATDIEDQRQALPPLLLIPLIENAFKHGASETRSEPFVDIHLSVKHRQLKLIVKNSAEILSEDEIKESIGLTNLRRQLQLLYEKYDLSVQHTNHVFSAILSIDLTSHV